MQQQTPSEQRSRPSDGLGHYLRDIVYGASDGVITTTAVIAGVAGASFEARVGIVLGLANLVADSASMGASIAQQEDRRREPGRQKPRKTGDWRVTCARLLRRAHAEAQNAWACCQSAA